MQKRNLQKSVVSVSPKRMDLPGATLFWGNEHNKSSPNWGIVKTGFKGAKDSPSKTNGARMIHFSLIIALAMRGCEVLMTITQTILVKPGKQRLDHKPDFPKFMFRSALLKTHKILGN